MLILLLAMIAAFLLTAVVRNYAIKANLVDIPNARSSHVHSTPRGGGISIVITFIIFSMAEVLYFNTSEIGIRMLFPLSGGIVVAVIGLVDDRVDLQAKWRILAHFLSAAFVMFALDEVPTLYVFSMEIRFQLVLYPIYALMLVWLLNLYNFMDGIDGIASVEAVSVFISAGVILFINGDNEVWRLFLIFGVSIVGFLVWNWQPAKIFMGDVCSGFLGFTLGVLALITSTMDYINMWSWMILLAVFVSDATYTLIYRIFKGDRWYQAHRTHAYQILSQYVASHQKVTLGVLVINLVWLFPLAYISSVYESLAVLVTLVAYMPLVFIVVYIKHKLSMRLGAS